MATVFVVLVLLTFVGNAIVTRSRTQWWRDPGSLFRAESEPEPQPVPQAARVRQPWEITPRDEFTPRDVVTPRAGRHAMRSDVAVPIEHAETELIARIPGGRLRHDRYPTR